MTRSSYDLVTVGGGMAGAALAKVIAERGARVLVLERETHFKDRVRGEMLAPWGVAEARELGILDLLKSSCAHEISMVDMGTGPRNLASTTQQQLPALTFAHPEMQETLISAAETAGAEVRRGVTVERIEPGHLATVLIRGASMGRISARLVVGADGRGSLCRKCAGFSVQEAPQDTLFAGVLLSGLSASEDLVYFIFNPELGTVVGFVPIGKNRFRSYFGYPKALSYRLQGEQMVSAFINESAKTFPGARQLYEGAKCSGPLASFDTGESWVQHPYRDGVALIGDAAGTSDPSFGQGLNLGLRDVRVLRAELSKNSDWDAAGHQYADQHGKYFVDCHTVEGWLRTLFQDPSPEAAVARQKAMPLIDQDPTRIPDHLFSGPDLPVNEQVRARFFGEA
ncbi:MAG TPA: NAD(P)/FAD-dependent oxidoreductase [Candidatus Sulfotelmatobacter sp.]|nr:NAD(P)/FAD-dependent oxidoreductase [Candidatus Sulfotelmatobacter sp.]